MTFTQGTVLVLGATGNQGGATARHLLAKGWHVRVLVRDSQKPAAQALGLAGAEFIQGDIDDQKLLAEITQGVYGIFSVQPFGYGDEARRGKNIADVAKEAGVQHVVYSSVGRAESLARANININKWKIEQYIQHLGLPATILRPVMFMEMLIGAPIGVMDGVFATALKPDAMTQLVAVDDIGAFAALAFERPDTYIGQTIELVGDVLTPPQIATIVSHATDQSIAYAQIPIEIIRQQSADFARALEYINETEGDSVDIRSLREVHPGLMDFATWLQKEGKARFKASLAS